MTWIADVTHFWFRQLTPDDWFAVNPALDETIRARFGALFAAMKAAPPDAATLDAQGHLAAVIMFDQFPRNMFRGTAQAFATDPLALALARDAVARGLDADLNAQELQFLYLPFSHGENAAMQARAVELFAKPGLGDALSYAREHKAVIDRFGRFPYRNRALGRATTAEEEAFLQTKDSWP
jgi:uncharacterized protein (DUF924 family)